MDLDTFQAVQSFAGVPAGVLLIPVLTSDVREFARAMQRLLFPLFHWQTSTEKATPWPLVADVLGVVWALLAWRGGLIPVPGLLWPTVVLVGLVMGLTASGVRDVAVRLRGAPDVAEKPGSSYPTGG